MTKKGILAVISGFSGAGKGTLVKRLLEDNDQFALSVSATTRTPRPGEEHGVHYFFITNEEFETMIENDEFLEHASYVNHHYGTPKRFVEEQLESGKDVILEIDVQGALQIKKKFPECLLLFVTTPSIDELVRRLHKRGSETQEQIAGRLKRAREEVDLIWDYDALIVACDPKTGAEQIKSAIAAARLRPSRNADLIGTLRNELFEERGE